MEKEGRLRPAVNAVSKWLPMNADDAPLFAWGGMTCAILHFCDKIAEACRGRVDGGEFQSELDLSSGE